MNDYNKDFFSIVITTYNMQRFIIQTLQSLDNQTFKKFEVIIVDDCSNDQTVEIIIEFIKDKSNWTLYVNKANKGVVYSRNKGFKLAKGEYICILDGDDIWFQNKLQVQYDFIRSNEVDICYTSYTYVLGDSTQINYIYHIKKDADYKSILKENYIGCSTVAFSRSITDSYLMNEDFEHEDFVFWLDLLKAGYIAKGIGTALVKYRLIKGSRSNNKIFAAKNRYAVYRIHEKMNIIKSSYYLVNYMINATIKNIRTHLISGKIEKAN